MFGCLPCPAISLILVLSTNFIKGRYELIEGLAVDHEASTTLWRVADDVCRSEIITEIRKGVCKESNICSKEIISSRHSYTVYTWLMPLFKSLIDDIHSFFNDSF